MMQPLMSMSKDLFAAWTMKANIYIYMSIFVDSITGLIMCFVLGLDETLVVINKRILYNIKIILFYMKINSEFYTTVTVL